MKKDNLLFRPLFDYPMTIVRICTGVGFIIQGFNVFDADFMAGHASVFDALHQLPMPEVLAYVSKGGELVLGIMLVLGLFTRVAALMLMVNMAVATFYALGGDIFSVDDFQTQLSWYYFLIGFALFVAGPTAYSLDGRWVKPKG